MTNVRHWRLWVPVLLLSLGLYLLAGCIYIPMFGKVVRGEKVDEKVGLPESRKPLRLGQSTRDEVERVLGRPAAVSRDGKAIAYVWTVQTALVIWPLCFQATKNYEKRGLVMRFSNDGVLEFYNVERWSGPSQLERQDVRTRKVNDPFSPRKNP